MRNYVLIALLSILLFSCKKSEKLPILGNPTIENGIEVPHTVPPFLFTNQNGDKISNETFKNKIQVADFFFTKCPTICPTVMSQMVRIYDKYEENEDIGLISFTLDPKRDTVETLKEYADNLEVDAPKWHLVTGEKKELHDLCGEYFNIVVDDEQAPGGINHSGKIVLVDKEGRIRSFAEGTDPHEVDKFIEDIDKLLAEYATE